MSFDYTSYELGKYSLDRIEERLARVLGDEEAAKLAVLLIGARDCSDVEERLSGYFAWRSLAWAYSPKGLPPSEKKKIVLATICRGGVPLDEDFLRKLSQPPESLNETREGGE